MALVSTSNNLLRSVFYRCGYLLRFQQSRPLCKGPPNKDPNQGSSGELHSSDSESDGESRQRKEGNTAKNVSEEKLTTGKEKVPKEEKKELAKKNLNDLLMSLSKNTDSVPVAPVSGLQLSKPKPRPKRGKKEVKDTKEEISPPSATEDLSTIEPGLAEAAKDVAESLGGDVKATESELLSTLKSHAAENSINDKTAVNLSELFVGMKVEREPRKKPTVQRRQPRQYDQEPSSSYPPQDVIEDPVFERRTSASALTTVNLFGNKPLGIFNKSSKENAPIVGESLLPVWDAAHEKELKMCVTHPPSNAFIEMIQWTKQGKLWTFPIDNEVGLEEEKKIGFHEHVFLEHHLQGWCPKRGPIRHFMELVCVGLSKNPHLTVERKKRHIEWYRNYFEAKQDILKEIGAIEAEQ